MANSATSILITGSAGLLGCNLLKSGRITHALWHQHPLPSTALRGALARQIDLCDFQKTRTLLLSLKPSCVIHAAALSSAALCEQEKDLARRVNVKASKNLAEATKICGAKFIFLSSDLIFDGSKGNYAEEDSPNPLGYYGKTKVEAEEEIRGANDNHVIVRASLIFGNSLSGNRGATEWMENEIASGRKPKLFTDEIRNPISAKNLADVLLELAENTFRGTLHVGGSEAISRHDFGVSYFQFAGIPKDNIIPAKISELNIQPPRAPNLSLNLSLATKTLETNLLSIQKGFATLKKMA